MDALRGGLSLRWRGAERRGGRGRGRRGETSSEEAEEGEGEAWMSRSRSMIRTRSDGSEV